jgi:hypothetical protein
MDILRHILDAGLPVLAVLVAFAAWIYAEALRHARRG